MSLELFTAEKLLEIVYGALVSMGVEITANRLWQDIRGRFQGDRFVEGLILKAERDPSLENVKRLSPFLQGEMMKDPRFNGELQELARQINPGDTIQVQKGIGKVETVSGSNLVGNLQGDNNTFIGTKNETHHHHYPESTEKKP